MKRTELVDELKEVRKWTSYGNSSAKAAEAAENRIVREFDQLWNELGYTRAIRDNLQQTVATNVELEIENQELKQKLAHALRNAPVQEEDDDD